MIKYSSLIITSTSSMFPQINPFFGYTFGTRIEGNTISNQLVIDNLINNNKLLTKTTTITLDVQNLKMKKTGHFNIKAYSERLQKSLANNSNPTIEYNQSDISINDYISHRSEVSGQVLSVSEKWYK
ncbi:MAG: hypothetical protein LLF93_03285 [Bacteroidales bacterium]|nr:hypothetical protein [Bacteroidales bacterium]